MIANWVTLLRIVLSFIAVILFELHTLTPNVIAFFFIYIIIFLDFLDGYLARKLHVSTEFGAMFDITGDRIVEIIFWIYFSFKHLISFWFPVIVLSRGVMVDTVRQLAFRKGIKPYDMFKLGFFKFLVVSPVMRTGYAVLKVIVFSMLGVLLIFEKHHIFYSHIHLLTRLTYFTAILTVIICVLRGVPVLFYAKDQFITKK